MILDNTLVLSDSQAITVDAASTNVIDLGATGTPVGAGAALVADIGKAGGIDVILNVVEAFATLTSLTVSVQVATDAVFTAPVEVASRTYALADINATRMLRFPAEIPEGANLRYLRFYYDVVGSSATAGKLTGAVVAARQTSMVR